MKRLNEDKILLIERISAVKVQKAGTGSKAPSVAASSLFTGKNPDPLPQQNAFCARC